MGGELRGFRRAMNRVALLALGGLALVGGVSCEDELKSPTSASVGTQAGPGASAPSLQYALKPHRNFKYQEIAIVFTSNRERDRILKTLGLKLARTERCAVIGSIIDKDRNVQRVLDYLERERRKKNSVVIFSAKNDGDIDFDKICPVAPPVPSPTPNPYVRIPGLTSVVTNNASLSLSVRDTGAIDGDRIAIWVNGVLIHDDITLTGSDQLLPLSLASGSNRVEIRALDEGLYRPCTAGVFFNSAELVSGSASQLTRGLAVGESDSLNVVVR